MDVQLYIFINGAWKEYNPKPAAHSHTISEVTGLQTTLNSKLNLSGGTMTGAITMGTNNITGNNSSIFQAGRIIATNSNTSAHGITSKGSRANMLYLMDGATGGLAASLLDVDVKNTTTPQKRIAKIGIYGGATSGTGGTPSATYLWLSAVEDNTYNRDATLKVDSNNRVGIAIAGSGRPTQALDVGGKIRMRTTTVDSDGADTVVTKGYMLGKIVSDTNNYLTSVTGSGNGTVTFNRQGLSSLTWDASHTHSQYLTSFIESDPTVPSWAKTAAPSAVRFMRMNANNTITWQTAANFRSDIGAGTSNFSGSYNDLSNKPSIPSIPDIMDTTEGNAGTATTQRTINAANLKSIILNHSPAGSRPASDVSAWAKKSSLAIGDIPTGTTGSTVALGNHTHSAATTSAAGFMSSADKTKLNSIATGAQKNSTITKAEIETSLGFTPENAANKITSIRSSGATDTAYVSELGVKTYVDGLIGSVYRPAGDWNAYTNAPALANNTPANAGKVYRVSVAGTRFGFTFAVGDKLAFNESGVISKWDNVDDVVSVNGETGAVNLTAAKVGARSNTWTPTWNQVTSKPTTFTPSSHNHTISEVEGLSVALNARAPAVHTHPIAQVDGLSTVLNTFAPSSHNHTISEVEGLQTALDNKVDNGSGVITNAMLAGSINQLKLSDISVSQMISEYSQTVQAPNGYTSDDLNSLLSSLFSAIRKLRGTDLYNTDNTQTIAGAYSNLDNKANGNEVVQATTESKNILGTTEEVFNISEKKVWFNKGALFYGTALAAGLVTRGISGTTTAGSAKDHLYINYDGNNTLSRQLVLGAGSTGDSRGHGIYDYSAVRGDAFIAYLTNTLGSYAKTITGAASTIASSDLTKNRALISNSAGKVVASAVTSTELGYLDGVTSSIQTQLSNKQDKLVAGNNITIDENTNIISASGGGGEVDLNEMAYFDYAGSVYGDKYSLLVNAWEHSLTVDQLEISATGSTSNPRGTAQYPNGETKGVIIPQGVTSIGSYAFYNWTSNNQPLVIPNSVTIIGFVAFFGWSSNNHPLIIPNSVKSIETGAFQNWTSNNQPLVIPNSVTSIGNYVFSNWSSVQYVEIQTITPPTLANANAFSGQNNAPIYVPNESVDDYKTATNWVSLADRIFPISDKGNTYTKGEIDLMIGDIENALDAILGV